MDESGGDIPVKDSFRDCEMPFTSLLPKMNCVWSAQRN